MSAKKHERSDSASAHVYGPPLPVVIGTLAVAAVFAFVLEFLVIISFVGQRLWQDPRLGSDLLFSLPLVMWVLVLAATALMAVRVLTTWLHVDADGFHVRGLVRHARAGVWDQVDRVVAVQDIDRATETGEGPDTTARAFDAVYLMAADGARLAVISGRFFGRAAQDAVLSYAGAAGVGIEYLDRDTLRALRTSFPRALSFGDLHPGMVLLLVVLFYVGHNALMFWQWGM